MNNSIYLKNFPGPLDKIYEIDQKHPFFFVRGAEKLSVVRWRCDGKAQRVTWCAQKVHFWPRDEKKILDFRYHLKNGNPDTARSWYHGWYLGSSRVKGHK